MFQDSWDKFLRDFTEFLFKISCPSISKDLMHIYMFKLPEVGNQSRNSIAFDI